MNAFDVLRAKVTKIADEILAIDGAYPTWDYADLMLLIDAVEDGMKKDREIKLNDTPAISSVNSITIDVDCDDGSSKQLVFSIIDSSDIKLVFSIIDSSDITLENKVDEYDEYIKNTINAKKIKKKFVLSFNYHDYKMIIMEE